jgi:hypothetical protein
VPQASKGTPVTRVARPGDEYRGGYPAGSKPVSQIKAPPPSVTKPASKKD